MTRPAGSAKLLRAINESAALGHLLDNGSLTRSRAARRSGASRRSPGALRELTGLSKPTTSEVLRRLTEAGLAIVSGHTSGGPGPNAEISADLAGGRAVEAIAAAVNGQCAEAGLDPDRLRHVRLGVPGAYDPRTDTIHHVDVPGLRRPGLAGELRRSLGTAVAVDNDVNLAAVAERTRGVAGAADSFVLMWIGGGLGLAIDRGGTLLRGARGGAGEIGYMPLGIGGLGGDLQDAVGGRAVVALAREHGVAARTPGEAVSQGDPAMLAELARRIAVGLAAVVAVLDPPLVVLAGEVGQAGGPALRDAVQAATRAAGPLDTEIAITGISDDAALLGALDAALAAIRDELIHTIQAGRPARPGPGGTHPPRPLAAGLTPRTPSRGVLL